MIGRKYLSLSSPQGRYRMLQNKIENTTQQKMFETDIGLSPNVLSINRAIFLVIWGLSLVHSFYKGILNQDCTFLEF